jgi:hypothetical protein
VKRAVVEPDAQFVHAGSVVGGDHGAGRVVVIIYPTIDRVRRRNNAGLSPLETLELPA